MLGARPGGTSLFTLRKETSATGVPSEAPRGGLLMGHLQPLPPEACGLSQQVPGHHHCPNMVFYSPLPHSGHSFPFCTTRKGLTCSGDLRLGPGHPKPRSWGESRPGTTDQPRPCLPLSLPRGTHLLLGKLIHYSLKAPFLAGSKLPALHFAATT